MSAGIWHDHPATARQAQLVRQSGRKHLRRTQADLMVSLLREKRSSGEALELPEIMRVGIAQHGARFAELRKRGFVIENQLERTADGRLLSRYWLRHDPERDAPESNQ